MGNVMIDALLRLLPVAETRNVQAHHQVKAHDYGLVTLHRPANVDDPTVLRTIVDAPNEVSAYTTLLFLVHPCTRQQLVRLGFSASHPRLRLLEPLSYLDFLALQRTATFVIMDSSCIQEETTYFGVSCLTVRENTERPVTISLGTSCLVGRDMGQLRKHVQSILAGEWKTGSIPPLWDGHVAERIARVIGSL